METEEKTKAPAEGKDLVIAQKIACPPRQGLEWAVDAEIEPAPLVDRFPGPKATADILPATVEILDPDGCLSDAPRRQEEEAGTGER